MKDTQLDVDSLKSWRFRSVSSHIFGAKSVRRIAAMKAIHPLRLILRQL